jgi:hypothetical protein
MTAKPLEWSRGAVVVVKALRGRANADGLVIGREIALALACDILPGESLIGAAISDPQVWGGIHQALIDRQQNGPDRTGSASIAAYGFGLQVEEIARRDGVRRVGERHVLAALATQLTALAIHPDVVRVQVESAEVGPGFKREEIEGQWHGLLETSVIIEYTDVREIDWRHETGAKKVTLWVPASVLNELDQLGSHGDSERVRDKAHKFTVGLLGGEQLDQALSREGLAIRDKGTVRLRVWAPTTMAGRFDTDHLEAAFELRDRGVPIVLITGDIGLTARAKTAGIATFRPDDDKWRLRPELSPREKELELRLKRAELQRPPSLQISARRTTVANVGALDIWVQNDVDAGEARTVLVMWRINGGADVQAWNRVGGATFGELYRGVDGRFHQDVPATIPPGADYQLAQVTFKAPPVSIEYEIWAAGSQRMTGTARVEEAPVAEAAVATKPNGGQRR